MRDLAGLTDQEVLQLVGSRLAGHPAFAGPVELARCAGLDPAEVSRVAAGLAPGPMQALRLLLALEEGIGLSRLLADDQEVLLSLIEGMGGVGPASRILMEHARGDRFDENSEGPLSVVCIPGV